jgi:hypothetical protein
MGKDAGLGHPIVGADVKSMPGRSSRTFQNGAHGFSFLSFGAYFRPSQAPIVWLGLDDSSATATRL